MNFAIFALCFLFSQNPITLPPYVVHHDNVGSACDSSDVGDSFPEEELNGEMLVDNAVGEIVAVSSDNSESFERNHHELRVQEIGDKGEQRIDYHNERRTGMEINR
ncbi:hypothetical protein REPUB_Repub19eG0026600 [Reevesia pubescens]